MTQKEAEEQDKELLAIKLDIRSLMEIAGFCAFEVLAHVLRTEVPDCRSSAVLVGPGNNGGDGLVIARYLKFSGYEVTVVCPRTKHTVLAEICVSVGVELVENVFDLERFDVVIDAVFGFSFRGPVRPPYDALLQKLRRSKFTISIDVPSGHVVDCSENDGFRPNVVICYTAPKICCKNLRFFVTRGFVPSSIAFPQNYLSFQEINNRQSLNKKEK